MPERIVGIISGFDITKPLVEVPGSRDPKKYILGFAAINDVLFKDIRIRGVFEAERERMILTTRFRQQGGKDATSYLSEAMVDLYAADPSFSVNVHPNRTFAVLYNRPDEGDNHPESFSAIVDTMQDGFRITSAVGTHNADVFAKGYQAHIEIGDRLGNIFYETMQSSPPSVDYSIIHPHILYASLPIR